MRRVEPLLAELSAQVSAPARAAAVERGERLDLAALVRELAASDGAGPG